MAKRILLVDDEEIILADLAHTLRRHGYEIAGTALSGPDAISAAASLSPDVVLMDIRLQGNMDGLEAATRIRETNDVPIIFVTANASALNLADFRGLHAVILKPFAPHQLRHALKSFLEAHDEGNHDE
jgi:CheY-like chemotaxis protein